MLRPLSVVPSMKSYTSLLSNRKCLFLPGTLCSISSWTSRTRGSTRIACQQGRTVPVIPTCCAGMRRVYNTGKSWNPSGTNRPANFIGCGVRANSTRQQYRRACCLRRTASCCRHTIVIAERCPAVVGFEEYGYADPVGLYGEGVEGGFSVGDLWPVF